MKKFFLVVIFFLFFTANLFAEYRLEPVQCTLKKQANCGAYLYNTKTGATYFCDSEKCEEVMSALEGIEEEEVTEGTEKSKKSKIPKKPKKEKKSKIPKMKKTE